MTNFTKINSMSLPELIAVKREAKYLGMGYFESGDLYMDSEEMNELNACIASFVTYGPTVKKMTPKEYGEYKTSRKHVAISQEIVENCQEVWVF